jgi:hypothetical protein
VNYTKSCIAASMCLIVFGWSPYAVGASRDDPESAIRALAAQTPKRVDAATTLIDVRSDGRGGVIYVSAVDTSMVRMPSSRELKSMLCDVGPDSPPPGNRNPFSSITYVYRDLQGEEIARLHLRRGECPGQAL